MPETVPVTKVLLCQKLNDEGKYEFRFSVLMGKREVVFVKNIDEEKFIKQVTSKLKEENIESFQKIQNVSRFSLTNDGIIAGETDMKKVPDRVFHGVKEILKSAVTKSAGKLEFV